MMMVMVIQMYPNPKLPFGLWLWLTICSAMGSLTLATYAVLIGSGALSLGTEGADIGITCISAIVAGILFFVTMILVIDRVID